MPQTTGGPGGERDKDKKKKKPDGPHGRPPGVTTRPPSAPPQGSTEADRYSAPPRYTPVDRPSPNTRTLDTMADRLTFIEKRTSGVLPKDVTWNLGQTSISPDDLSRFSRQLARDFDLPLEDYFNRVYSEDIKGNSLLQFEDPISGGMLSLPTARRLLEAQEHYIIEQWLQGTENTRRRQPLSSKSIIATLDDLTPLVGDQLNFGEALAIARDVAASGRRREFGQNFQLLLRGAMRNEPRLAAAIATKAADEGVTFGDFADAVAYLAGVEKGVVAGSLASGDEITLRKGDRVVLKSSVGDLQVFKQLYDAIRNKETSYSQEAERILAEMEYEESEEGIGARFINGTLHALDIVNRPLDAVTRVLIDPYATGFAVRHPVTRGKEGIESVQLTGEEDPMQYQAVENAFRDAKDILTGDAVIWDLPRLEKLGIAPWEVLAAEMAISIALPAGAAAKAMSKATTGLGKVKAGLTLGAEFVVDPLTIAGKVGRVAGQRRFLPFLNEADQGRAITKFLTGRQRRLGGVDASTFLVRAVKDAPDPEAYFRRAIKSFRTTFSTDGIHPIVARSIYSWVQKGTAAGLDEETLARGVRGFFADSLGMPVKDPLAREIVDIVENTRRNASRTAASTIRRPLDARELAEAAKRHGQQVMDQIEARNVGRTLQSQLDRAGGDLFTPLMHEVPHVRGSHRVASTLSEKPWARALRATRIMELPLRSGNFFRFVPDQDPVAAVDGLATVMTRSRVFSQADIQSYRQEFTTAMRKGMVNRESEMASILKRLEDDMLDRISSQLGVAKDDLVVWADDLFRTSGTKRTVTAITREGGEVSRPLRPAQLPNQFNVLDPVVVRKAAKEQMGWGRELRAAAFRAVGKDAPIVKGTPKGWNLSHAIGAVNRTFTRKVLAGMKLGWVARPAYVLRIVGMDESLRLLATMGPAARMRASRAYARHAAKAGLQPEDMALALRTGLEPEVAMKFRLPGLLDTEAQANQGAMKVMASSRGDILPADIEAAWFDQWATVGRRSDPMIRDLDGVVSVDDDQFVSAWYRALFQYGQDDAGREALKWRVKGLDEDEAIDRIIRWHNTTADGKAAMARMKQVEGWDMETATRQSVEYLWDLTPNPALADFPLQGTLTSDILKAMPDKPTLVHGPAMNPHGNNFWTRGLGAYTRAILEHPTNKLIRQPFFKHHYSQTYTFLREQARAAGKTITDQMDAAFQAEAKRFAINRTKEIMFDFTRTGRMAEMLWFVSPFFQPFTEFLVAWPKIVRQNPALIGYANRLGQAAAESKLFQTDPQTGEQVIPLSNFAGAAPLLAAVTGGKYGAGGSLGGGWELLTPLSAMNMFMSSAFPLDVAGVTIPVPTPSFSPPAQWAVQEIIKRADIDEDNKAKLMAWATEYGEIDFDKPLDWIAPTWAQRMLEGAVPSWFENETNRNVSRFLALQQAMALERGEEWDSSPEAMAEATKRARWQARNFSFARAFISAFFPGAPRINFPTADLEDEWNELYEASGGDSGKALEAFAGVYNPDTNQFEGGRHPGMTLVALSKTMWADEENPFSMPATQAVDRILNSEGGKRFAKQFPRWVFFLIPKELREGEVDFGVLNAQIASGQRKVLDPVEFDESEDVRNGWNAYFKVKEQWDAWTQAHPDVESGDPSYDARQNIFNDQVEGIAEMFPRWQGANELSIERGVDINVMREARLLANSKEFSTKTDLGRGLSAYFEGRDQLAADMAAKGISNIDTIAAADAGFTKRWENLTSTLSEQHPDFGRVFEMFFEQDLTRVKTEYDRELDKLSPDERETLSRWEDHWERLRTSPYSGDQVTEDEQFSRYAAIRNWANTAYAGEGPNPLKLWWKGQTPNAKADYASSISNRSPIYWSRFDWELMGLKPTEKSINFWTEIEERRTKAFDRLSGVGAALDVIDRDIAQAAKRNPVIRRQLEAMNTWGYGLKKLVFGEVQGLPKPLNLRKTKGDWEDIFDGAALIQKVADKHGLTGTGDFDEYNKGYYIHIREAFADYIEEKRQNPVFEKQWDFLQEQVGMDRLLGILVPQDNFPLGVVEGSAARAAAAGKVEGRAHVGGRKLVSRGSISLARKPMDSLLAAQQKLNIPVIANVAWGYRTRAEQASLYSRRGSNPLPVAPPGSSVHESGLAVDIDSDFLGAHPELVNYLRNNGWVQPMPEDDPPHWEWRG